MWTNKKRADAKKQYEKDYLTNFANRNGFLHYYKKLRKANKVHIVFIDVDNFKRVNELFGHSMGDWVLKTVSNIIRKNVNDEFVARMGGDEFIIVFNEELGKQNVIDTVEEIMKEVNLVESRKEITSLVSLSIGVIFDQDTNQSIDDLLYKCDAAIYQAKIEGKSRYVIYKPHVDNVETNKIIETEMESALEDGQFKVYLQPKVNMVSGKIVGAEALVRWEHPTKGLRTPDNFIPLFEKNGFIVQLDLYMFEEVCKLKKSMKDKTYGAMQISVNISRLHLYDKSFSQKLNSIANKYSIDTSELELEITESVFLRDRNELINTIVELRDKGFSVSIDDFGSGYSALNMLKDIPANTIKIDKEFLRLTSDDIRGKKILKNVINMCRDLKLDVITEGVETEEQVEYVTKCGCELAQGFFYSKPLTVERFIEYVEEAAKVVKEVVEFSFNNTLESIDGRYKCDYITRVGEDSFIFEKGVNDSTGSVFLPGGRTQRNLFEMPIEIMKSESYTIVMWVKPKKLVEWSSVLYVKFEMGFASIVPLAWDDACDFRIRDSKEVDGWHDTRTSNIEEGIWTHIAISYDARKEVTKLYINGICEASKQNIPAMRYVKLIYVGGDVFQPSFIGNISELKIFSEAKEDEEIKKLYDSYVVN